MFDNEGASPEHVFSLRHELRLFTSTQQSGGQTEETCRLLVFLHLCYRGETSVGQQRHVLVLAVLTPSSSSGYFSQCQFSEDGVIFF
ncbi:hypothetical protein Q5P01_022244 [Channa striata]|uniref:Uncharacterized protein n=1 Tax=Channa striata TaxID=64152 RepID=A0AA88LPM4_CHASR|nr:hypothetical protein Q5P01_022244 [Channa striata]